jgi:ABC-type phosphate transport system substrate-binding protein
VGQSFANNTVVPRARIIGSGTRQSFLDLTATRDLEEQAKIASTGLPRGAGNPEIEGFIGANPDQIGYVGLAFFDPNIRAVALDFVNNPPNPATAVFPSEATVINGTYPMGRNLHLFTLPISANPKQRIQDFLSWSTGPEAQSVVKNVGFVPVGPQAPDWDVNLDRTASILDIAQIGVRFGQTAPASGNPADPLIRGWVRADSNWDGTVNILDVATVGNAWGQSW